MNQAPTLHSNHQEIKVMPTRLFMVTAILSGLTTLSSAADWPQFRGANSAGHADSAAVATNFGPGKNERWNVPVASVLQEASESVPVHPRLDSIRC